MLQKPELNPNTKQIDSINLQLETSAIDNSIKHTWNQNLPTHKFAF